MIACESRITSIGVETCANALLASYCAVTVNASGNTLESTRRSQTGSRPGFFRRGTLTNAVISVSPFDSTLPTDGRGPLPRAKLTADPSVNPVPVIVTQPLDLKLIVLGSID